MKVLNDAFDHHVTIGLVKSKMYCLFLGLELLYLKRLYQVYRMREDEFIVVELSRMIGWIE